MNRARGQVVIVVSDALLAFCLEMVKLQSEVLINNEFAMNFVAHLEISSLYIFGTAILTLLVAGIADSLSCKFFPIVFGLFAGLLSLVCAVVGLWIKGGGSILGMLCKVFLLVYIATSAIRDMFIMEQIKFPGPNQIHRYIFFLVYPKIIAKGLCHIGFEKFSISMRKIILTVCLVVYLVYLFLFAFGLIIFFYIEPIYMNMWGRSLKCYFRSLKCKRKEPKGPKTTESFSSVNTYNMHMHEPEITKKCVGFKAFSTEHPDREDIIRKTPSPPPQEKKKSVQKENLGFRGWLGSLVISSKPEKKKEVVDEEDEEPQAAVQSEVKEVTIYKGHWLHKSAPKSSEYVIVQTARFLEVFPIIIAGSFFSMLDYFVSAITYIQAYISSRNMDTTFDQFEYDRISFVSDAVMFPLFYFLIFRLLRKTFRRDIRFFFLGYLLILAANILMLAVQTKAIVGQEYVPGPGAGQVRLYNGLNQNISLSPLWEEYTVQMPPHGYYVISDIHLETKSDKKPVKLKGTNLSSTESVVVLDRASTAYVVTMASNKIVLVRVGEEDISAFGKNREGIVKYKVIAANDVDLKKVQVFFEERRPEDENFGKKVYQRLTESGLIYDIEPGEYNIIIGSGNTIEYGYSLLRPVTMEKWGVYSLFFYPSEDGKKVEARHYHLEGPPGIKYSFIYFHIIIASLARAFATVPFYMFLYCESPEKLRSAVISMVLFFNLIWFAIFNSSFIDRYNHGKHMTFMVAFIVVHSIIFLLMVFTIKIRHRRSGY